MFYVGNFLNNPTEAMWLDRPVTLSDRPGTLSDRPGTLSDMALSIQNKSPYNYAMSLSLAVLLAPGSYQ